MIGLSLAIFGIIVAHIAHAAAPYRIGLLLICRRIVDRLPHGITVAEFGLWLLLLLLLLLVTVVRRLVRPTLRQRLFMLLEPRLRQYGHELLLLSSLRLVLLLDLRCLLLNVFRLNERLRRSLRCRHEGISIRECVRIVLQLDGHRCHLADLRLALLLILTFGLLCDLLGSLSGLTMQLLHAFGVAGTVRILLVMLLRLPDRLVCAVLIFREAFLDLLAELLPLICPNSQRNLTLALLLNDLVGGFLAHCLITNLAVLVSLLHFGELRQNLDLSVDDSRAGLIHNEVLHIFHSSFLLCARNLLNRKLFPISLHLALPLVGRLRLLLVGEDASVDRRLQSGRRAGLTGRLRDVIVRVGLLRVLRIGRMFLVALALRG